MSTRIARRFVVVVALVGTSFQAMGTAAEPKIRFEKHRLDAKFRSEGVAVADFNGDKKLDIAAGCFYYAAPDWKPTLIMAEEKDYPPKGYSDCFNAFADDLNNDGWSDLIHITWPGKAAIWLENPGAAGGEWKSHVVAPVASNESPQYQDVDGDGKRDLVIGFANKNPDGDDRRMGVASRKADPHAAWKINPISAAGAPGTRRYEHGLGVGDVNGDGRNDVLVPAGWWEAPESPGKTPWDFHAAPFGAPCSDVQVFDYDGDGDADVLTSSAHDFGIWYHEQTADGWKTHEIDKSYSQTHALCLADINGDGLPDFVTGKRWWAHGGRDPGGADPAVFYWYELTRKAGKAEWIRHQFDHDSGPGTQFQVIDVNGDGMLDVVSSNKKGVHYFEQQRD